MKLKHNVKDNKIKQFFYLTNFKYNFQKLKIE